MLFKETTLYAGWLFCSFSEQAHSSERVKDATCIKSRNVSTNIERQDRTKTTNLVFSVPHPVYLKQEDPVDQSRSEKALLNKQENPVEQARRPC